jgi:hypothetical protein
MGACVGCAATLENRKAGRRRLYCLTCRPLTKQQVTLLDRARAGTVKVCRWCQGIFTGHGLNAYCSD